MRIVVTGGGTVAPIDDVRVITNLSSGRFAATITEACLRRGAEVWHIHAPTAQLPFQRLARFDLNAIDPDVELNRLIQLRLEWRGVRERLHLEPLVQGTVRDYAATLERVLRSERIDVAFLAMAASDFEPVPVAGKLDSDAENVCIHAVRSPKVIQSVRDWAPGIFLVGFKLLSRVDEADLVQEAEIACRAQRADVTVANDFQTLREGRHTIHLVRPDHAPETLGPAPDLAERLVDRILAWAGPRSQIPQPSEPTGKSQTGRSLPRGKEPVI
jgi:phosphopantothenate-cysteine ligase